jgi:hypothetical protein
MYGMRLESLPHGIVRLTSTDLVQRLDCVVDFPESVNEILVVCEGGIVRVGLGGTDAVGGLVGLKLEPGSNLWLGSRAAIRTFSYVSDSRGVPGVLQVVKLVRSH